MHKAEIRVLPVDITHANINMFRIGLNLAKTDFSAGCGLADLRLVNRLKFAAYGSTQQGCENVDAALTDGHTDGHLTSFTSHLGRDD